MEIIFALVLIWYFLVGFGACVLYKNSFGVHSSQFRLYVLLIFWPVILPIEAAWCAE